MDTSWGYWHDKNKYGKSTVLRIDGESSQLDDQPDALSC